MISLDYFRIDKATFDLSLYMAKGFAKRNMDDHAVSDEDLQQELLCHLLGQASKFDGQDDEWLEFANAAMRQKLQQIYRKDQCLCNEGRNNCLSLDMQNGSFEGKYPLPDPATLNPVRPSDIYGHHDLIRAVRRQVTRLKPKLKELAELLMDCDPVDGPASLGIPDSTYFKRLLRLKVVMRKRLCSLDYVDSFRLQTHKTGGALRRKRRLASAISFQGASE